MFSFGQTVSEQIVLYQASLIMAAGPVTVSLNAGDVVVWDSRVFRRMLSMW